MFVDERESAAMDSEDLTSGHGPDHHHRSSSYERRRPETMKSSSSCSAATVDAVAGRTDSETDSDGPRNAAVARRPAATGRYVADEVCNKSVRDKIAMFSRAGSTSSSASSLGYSTGCGSQDSSPAQSPKAFYGTLPRKAALQHQWPQPQQQRHQQHATAVSTSSDATAAGSEPQQQQQHRRSQSLVEQPYSKYFNTMNAYAEMGRSSLNALIEQRRRSMSKLRGLVIPEKTTADDQPTCAIPDLPVIKSNRGAGGPDDDDERQPPPLVLCTPTKTYVNGPPPIVGTATRRVNPVKTIVARQSVAAADEQRRPSSSSSSTASSSSSVASSSSSSSSLNSSREELRHIHDERPPSAKGSFKADSDEDSALSSSRSSISLQYSPASSPPPPPLPQHPAPTARHSQSNNNGTNPSAAVGACCETGKRVLKAESVEAINRKNVLCSARISSGKPETPPQPAANGKTAGGQYKTEYYCAADALPIKSAAKSAAAASARYTHNRMSSMESTTSDDSSMQYAVNAEPFGSISSLASSTSLISQQELQQLIDDANQTLEETSGGGVAALAPVPVEVMVVILHRDNATSSVGITLAGGADYETKEITVSPPMGPTGLICGRNSSFTRDLYI